MKTILLYTQEELNQVALKAVKEVNSLGSCISWELEISNDELPRLHVTYKNLDDVMSMIFVSLESPKTYQHKEQTDENL